MIESICLIFHAISLVGLSIVLTICPNNNFLLWKQLFNVPTQILGTLSILILYTLFCFRVTVALEGSIFEMKKYFKYCLSIPAFVMFLIWVFEISFRLITHAQGLNISSSITFSLFYMIYIIMNLILLYYLLKKLYIIVKSALNQSNYIKNTKKLTSDDDIKNYMLTILSADNKLLNQEINKNNNDELFKKAIFIAYTMIKIFVCISVAILSNFVVILIFALYGSGVLSVYFRPYLTVITCLDALLNNVGLLFQYSLAQALYKKYFKPCHLCIKKCCLTLAINSTNGTNKNDTMINTDAVV